MNWNTSRTSPLGLVAWPRMMSIPNDDSTPQMFENKNGLSSVATAKVQMPSLRSSERCTSSDGCCAPAARGDRSRLAETAQIALR